jgi:hypothetical protein
MKAVSEYDPYPLEFDDLQIPSSIVDVLGGLK